MVRDGIKAAQIQAKYSTLNSSWAAGSFPPAHVVSAAKNAAARLTPRLGSQRRAGRHAAPSHTFLSRLVPR